ncbi:hypothetical protein P8918_12535 [Bacillus spizizenii]|nr:hypothetical protein [Bacillus spizizenii]MCY8890397.1 hypothetical protein [Bacillus spizizenii]MEC0841852.1 hypothetical protein [Bacillus spizizenii]
MNLSARYAWIYTYEIDMHVTVSRPFDVHDNNRELLKHFEPGLNGKIVSFHWRSRTFSVYFEDDSYHEFLDPCHFTVRTDLNATEAYNTLKSFFGHYTKMNEHYYQFNIKMHHYDIPTSVIAQIGMNRVWDIIGEQQENLFNLFSGKDADYAPLSFFDWISEYWMEGKNGGYLLLRDSCHVKESYEEAEYQFLEAATEYASDEEYLEENREELEAYEKELIERAYDLKMIEALIKKYQDDHFKEINSHSFWQNKIRFRETF